LKVHLHSHTG